MSSSEESEAYLSRNFESIDLVQGNDRNALLQITLFQELGADSLILHNDVVELASSCNF